MRYAVGVTTDQIIGKNVHEVMWAKRVSHRALYEAMGLSRSSLSKKMRGQVAWSAADVVTAARVLGVDAGQLLPEGVSVTGEYLAAA